MWTEDWPPATSMRSTSRAGRGGWRKAEHGGFLTGLDRASLRRYFVFDAGEGPRPGKRPDSPERFVKNATLFTIG